MSVVIFLFRTCRAAAFAALALTLGTTPVAIPQEGPPTDPLVSVPLMKWITEGPVAQIPWKVKISSSGLSYHQRLVGTIDVRVDGKDLVNRPHDGSLVCLVRLMDDQGNASQEHLELELGNVKAETARSDLQFLFEPYLKPGVYKALLVLWHSKTGEHSLTERSLQIEPLNKDPLPEADSDMPNVEFSRDTRESLDDFYQSDIRGRLHLRLNTVQPVRVDLLADVTPLELRAAAYKRSLALLLPLLKTFSQIEVINGSLDVGTLDMSHLRVGFEQEDLGLLDWAKLRNVLATADPGVVGVQELQNRKEQATFFRQEIRKRLTLMTMGPKIRGRDGLRVIILLSSWYEFESGNDLTPIPPPADCHCLVFYLRLVPVANREGHVSSVRGWKDDLERILGPLKPRVYEIDTPLSARKALADILDRISQASAAAANRS